MKLRTFNFLFFIAIFLPGTGIQVMGQELTKTQISNIDFELDEGKILITYDLLKSEKTERFIIYVNAITESGDTILSR